jgi:hypothetical protein
MFQRMAGFIITVTCMQPARLMQGFLRKGNPRPSGWDAWNLTGIPSQQVSVWRDLRDVRSTYYDIWHQCSPASSWHNICTALRVPNGGLQYLRAERSSFAARSAGMKSVNSVESGTHMSFWESAKTAGDWGWKGSEQTDRRDLLGEVLQLLP